MHMTKIGSAFVAVMLVATLAVAQGGGSGNGGPLTPPMPPVPNVLYAAIDTTGVVAATGPTLSGWAVNCATGQQPTRLRVYYTSIDPSGAPSLAELAISAVVRGYRPDVAVAIGTNCGGIATPGASQWLGWTATGAVVPVGAHTFYLIIDDPDYQAAMGHYVPSGWAVFSTSAQ